MLYNVYIQPLKYDRPALNVSSAFPAPAPWAISTPQRRSALWTVYGLLNPLFIPFRYLTDPTFCTIFGL